MNLAAPALGFSTAFALALGGRTPFGAGGGGVDHAPFNSHMALIRSLAHDRGAWAASSVCGGVGTSPSDGFGTPANACTHLLAVGDLGWRTRSA